MTPWPVFKALNDIFHFVADMAAEEGSAKCSVYVSREINTLTEDWSDWADEGEYVFMNPPYGKPTKDNPGVEAFVRKAWVESWRTGVNAVLLLHAKTDTQWWHKYCWKADEIWEVEGRISFINPDTGKPGRTGSTTGQAIVIFRRDRRYQGFRDGPTRKRVDRGMNELRDHLRLRDHPQSK
jgi:site-specific DNA-methyltransferase (adenine-specific)